MIVNSISKMGSFFLIVGNFFSTGEPLFSPKSEEGQALFSSWKECLYADTKAMEIFLSLEQALEETYLNALKREEFTREFSRIFVVPHQDIRLWESTYLSEKGSLYAENMYAVRDFYTSSNFAFIHTEKECDDHIAVELSFLGVLLLSSVEQVESLERAKEFIDKHLSKWSILCIGDLRMYSTTEIWNILFSSTIEALEYVFRELDYNIPTKEHG